MLAVQTLVLAVLLWLAFRLLRRATGGFLKGGVDGGGGDKPALSVGAAAAAAAAAAGRSPREAQLAADTWEFAAEADLPPRTTAARILILYATEYGFSKDVARRVAAALATGTIPANGGGGAGAAVAAAAAAAFEDDLYGDDGRGAVGSGLSGLRTAVAAAAGSREGGGLPPLVPRVVNMADWRAVRLGREAVVLVVMSTTGDGVVPSEATELKEALEMDGVGALRLDGGASGGRLPRYSVLALGDRGYPHFCRGGIIMETLLDGAITAAMKEQREAAAAATGAAAAAAAAGEPTMNGNGTAAVAAMAALTARQDVDQEDWASITDWLSWTVTALADLHRVGQLPTVIVGGHGVDDAAIVADDDADGSVDYLVDAVRAYAAEEGAKNGAGGSTALTHYSRNAPLMAAVVEKTTLTTSTAVVPDVDRKEVVRVVFDTAGSSLAYTAGDALGIVPHNDPATVARVLVALAADGGEEVGPAVGSGAVPASPPVAGGVSGAGVGGGAGGSGSGASTAAPTTLREALTSAVDLKTVRAELLAALARAAHASGERSRAAALAASPAELTAYASDREVLDALSDFPSAALAPRELLKALRPLHARYYSVSSSPVTSPTAVAITVDVLRYTLRGVPRQGVASSQLADRIALGDRVGVFITPNAHFRLPVDGSTPIVMIGPGTGVAPFVGFLDERAARGGSGRNVLFTGCRHEQQDFLYGAKLRAAAAAGALELHAAFSRDGPAKVYVQHLMAAVADDLWELVDRARAHVYVCGDAKRMAGDVRAAWLAVVRRGRECDAAAAEAYMADLEKAGRYQRDVWAS